MNRGGEKTEKPTQKRLREARRRGQVWKSQDLTSALLLIASSVTVVVAGRWSGGLLGSALAERLERAAAFRGQLDPASALAELVSAAASAALALLPLLATLMVLAGVINYLQVGPVLAVEPVTPKLERLNPAHGFKQKFLTGRPYVELVKTILKIVVATAVVLTTIWARRADLIQLSKAPAGQVLMFTLFCLFEIGIKVGIAFLVLAVGDVLLQRFFYMKEVKMTKQEVRDEYKETEGNPLHKMARRQQHREILVQNMVAAVRNADVVVANPTHVAVALKYDGKTMSAPTIAAKGADLMAARLRRIARESGVPVMRDIGLARSLYELDIESEIPDNLYEPVAIVLRWVYQLSSQQVR